MKTKHGAPVLKVKDIGEDGRFSGYASVFGNKDSYGDVVVRGAFTKSLSEHRKRGSMPKLFWQHDSHRPIGKWLSLEEDDIGLRGEGMLNMGVQQAREAHALLKENDIDGLSIGYHEIDTERSGELLLLKELDLVEASIVSLGANDQALIDAVKSILNDGRMPSVRQFERFLRDAGVPKSRAAGIATLSTPELLRDAEDDEDEQDPMAQFLAAMANAPVFDLTGDDD